MNKKPRIAIAGAGKHAWAMLDLLLLDHPIEEIAIYDDNPALHGTEVYGVKIEGPIDIASMPELVHVAIGGNQRRKKLSEKVLASGRQLFNIVGPLSYRARSAKVGPGLGAYPGAQFLTDCEVGTGLIVGNSTVDRLCKVGDWVRISHGVRMAPEVKIGEGAVIGVGAVLMGGVKIGAWATVGAGALVTRDVPDGHLVAALPSVALPPMRPNVDRATLRAELGKVIADHQGRSFDLRSEDLMSIGVIDSYTILLMIHFVETKYGVSVDVQNLDYGIFKSLDRFLDATLDVLPKNRGITNDRMTFV